MKIATKQISLEKALAKKRPAHKKPLRPNFLLATLIRILAIFDLWPTKFSYTTEGMEKLGKKEPCLILMNHSSFIDLKMASKMLYPRPYNIICTSDGLVGKEWLMRNIGCVPTVKFVSDLTLIRDMIYSLRKLKCSVLMYPEAGYSFDGKSTVLPDALGKCLKLLDVPVVMITTYGAFGRDPLYNGLRLRRVKVTADMKYHDSLDAFEAGMNVIDAGHYPTEYVITGILENLLKDVETVKSENKDVFRYI